ncbi:MAG: M2 family metallopeptidase [Planctomycetota bacterium]|jgi:peptidyl-dipeptidase A
MKIAPAAILISVPAVLLFGCAPDTKERQLETFISAHVKQIRPMAKQVHLAYWAAANSGNSEDYDKVSKLEFEIRQIYSNPEDFGLLKNIKNSGEVKDAVLLRQLDGLYNAYLKNQIEPGLLKRIVDLSTEIAKNFSTFRGTIAGKKVTDNEIREILKAETDSLQRKQAWLASKQVGPVVAPDLIRLVRLRNEAARQVGFDNYHTLSLTVAEQDVKELDRIFNELYELTNKPFAELKAELDGLLAARYGVSVTELRPWHYHDPFFQETPLVYELDLDIYYKDKDVKELATQFYDSIGLPVDSILERSDLYEREGKNPHAFCTDIDKEGDVRILCNLKNNEQWMETMLHELGHAVYDKYHDPEVPYLLREPAHIFTTEAIAMFFGRLSRNAAWMQQMLDLSDEQRTEIERVSGKYATLKQLIFVRWAMVMYDFEKQLYRNPDQDLNSLWWEMVDKYQLVNKPEGRAEPDWAAKIHFTIAPVYYHNYVLGELLASQLRHRIVYTILRLKSDTDVSFVGRRSVGRYLREEVFEPGAVYRWDEMVERATGEPLTPKYFVGQFVN